MLLEFLRAFVIASKDSLGTDEKTISFKTGEIVGEKYSKKEISEIREEFKKLNMELSIQVNDKNVICSVSNSFECSLRRGFLPSCHILRGFFTSLWKDRMTVEKIKVEEIECRTKGNKNCVFIIKEEAHIPIIERRREVKTINMLRKLREG